MSKIIIAIDGFSACGKSTLAKALAKALGYVYVDTGAMYRAVTLYFIQNKVDYSQATAVSEALKKIHISFQNIDQKNTTFLNGQNVENEIRQMYVSKEVSPVATISAVRRAMVAQQQAMGRDKGIVMDGRDIGTVVFPEAELKLFLTADTAVRALRRFKEYESKNQVVDLDTIQHNLEERDRIDSTRADSPLKQAEDAVVLDNSQLTQTEQLNIALDLVKRTTERTGLLT